MTSKKTPIATPQSRKQARVSFGEPVGPKVANARLMIHAWVDLCRVERSLRKSGFQKTIRDLELLAVEDDARVTRRDVRVAYRYSQRIAEAAWFTLPRARCLHRSLVLHRWLRSEGLPSVLRIGVSKQDNELRAHAWVELAGIVVNDPPAAVASFTALKPRDIAAADMLPWI